MRITASLVLTCVVAFGCSAKSPTAPSSSTATTPPATTAPAVAACTFEVTGPTAAVSALNQQPQTITVKKSAASCSWTATTTDAFIRITSVTDTSVTYTLAGNAGPERTGIITVAGQAVEIRQAVGPAIGITGTISTTTGFRLLNVKVEVVGATPAVQTVTDNLGGYRLAGIRNNPVTLRISHASYKTVTADYDVLPGSTRTDANHALESNTVMPARGLAVLDASHTDADLRFTIPGATPATWVKAAWGLYPVAFNGSFWPHTQISACFKKAGVILRHTCDIRVIQCAFNVGANDCSVMPDTQEFRPSVQDGFGITDIDGVIILVSNQFSVDRSQDPVLNERAIGLQNASERAMRIRFTR